MFSHLQGSRALSDLTLTLEDQHQNSEYPPFLLLPASFTCWVWCQVVWDIPLVSWDQLFLLSPPNFLCLTSLLTVRVVQEPEEALALCKHCSPTATTSLYCHHCFQHNFKTQPHVSSCEESYLYPREGRIEVYQIDLFIMYFWHCQILLSGLNAIGVWLCSALSYM